MRKSYALLAVLVLLSFVQLRSEIVDLTTAKSIAKNVYYERAFQVQPIAFDRIQISNIWIERENSQPVFYIFNFENNGFVIVSGEDVLPPVLGYSLTGSCSDIGLDPNFDSFMESYSDQIAFIRQNQIVANSEITSQWEKYSVSNPSLLETISDNRSVDELLTCLWNQNSPYNMLSPEDPMGPGGHAYAGCVATAMSMVMYYWRYPLQGEGSNTYSWDPYGIISANFGNTTYNWNQMMDEMDPNYEDVALIQFHCGVAVEMMYSASGSGAYSWDVPPAIRNHFGYSTDAHFLELEDYELLDWIDILKEQLDESQPMYYSGFSNSGGHAFVCDAYDDNNYFHFNFGWSGSSNGYYTLYSVGGFNNGQGVVVNFIPGDNYPYTYTGLQTLTSKSGSFEDGSGPKVDYAADSDISWLIDPQTEEDSITSINLNFSRFELTQADEVTIYDGESPSSNVLAVYSGNTIPNGVSSTGNKMLVVFKSNDAETANGFLATFTTDRPVWCSGLEDLTAQTGEFSDGSLHFDYDNNKVCMWRIQPEGASSTTMYFTSFDTEADNDVVKIFDLESQEILAEYSGSYTDEMPAPVTAPSGKLFIAFSTNKSITKAGWEAYYISTIVGLDELANISRMVDIFPNPASEIINLSLEVFQQGPLSISLISVNGDVVKQLEINSRSGKEVLTINVSDLLPGSYILLTEQSGKQTVNKITVQ
nr:C10 family peptidase [Bacteroidota bacterium]